MCLHPARIGLLQHSVEDRVVILRAPEYPRPVINRRILFGRLLEGQSRQGVVFEFANLAALIDLGEVIKHVVGIVRIPGQEAGPRVLLSNPDHPSESVNLSLSLAANLIGHGRLDPAIDGRNRIAARQRHGYNSAHRVVAIRCSIGQSRSISVRVCSPVGVSGLSQPAELIIDALYRVEACWGRAFTHSSPQHPARPVQPLVGDDDSLRSPVGLPVSDLLLIKQSVLVRVIWVRREECLDRRVRVRITRNLRQGNFVQPHRAIRRIRSYAVLRVGLRIEKASVEVIA
jgi:hypothetical protein